MAVPEPANSKMMSVNVCQCLSITCQCLSMSVNVKCQQLRRKGRVAGLNRIHLATATRDTEFYREQPWLKPACGSAIMLDQQSSVGRSGRATPQAIILRVRGGTASPANPNLWSPCLNSTRTPPAAPTHRTHRNHQRGVRRPAGELDNMDVCGMFVT